MKDKVQLIRQEIERRIKEISDACDGVIMVETISVEYNTLCNIRDYINSLPEDNHFESKNEMVSEDLDKEIGYYTTSKLLGKRNHSTGIYHLTQKECDNIARHFAEWKERQIMEKVKIVIVRTDQP